MRIGLFGGTFDPIHLGHLLLAECCREALDLDEVRFLPAASNPLKVNAARSPTARSGARWRSSRSAGTRRSASIGGR